jgi:membrane-associated phospholipid phosphatase
MPFDEKSKLLTFEPSKLLIDAPIGRRRLLALSTTLGAAALGARIIPSETMSGHAQGQLADPPAPGHTWLLEAPDALRPDAPATPTTAEIDELLDFQADRSEEMLDVIDRWAGRQAVLPWLELGTDLTSRTYPPGLLEIRAQSLLRTAMHDAVVAALDAQNAIERPLPETSDDRIEPIDGPFPAVSSFPSLHATVAGAASTVLAHVFPEASQDGFAELANEAATSRLWAGANYRSDIDAGLALGRAIGQLAVEYGQTDGTSAQWDGEGWPVGEGLYERTPPNFADPIAPLAGTWSTWVLPSGDALRPAAYPAYGSLPWTAELSCVRRMTEQRTLDQERIIDYWLSQGPNVFYTRYAQDLIERARPGEAETAAVLAMASVAMFDALVAVWDAKYQYWTARPSTMDPEIDLYIPDPPYPSYPGGFAAACSSGAGVLADVFPEAAEDLLATAEEGAMLRAWCGIHYVLDNDIGVLMGGQAARATVDLVRNGLAS